MQNTQDIQDVQGETKRACENGGGGPSGSSCGISGGISGGTPEKFKQVMKLLKQERRQKRDSTLEERAIIQVFNDELRQLHSGSEVLEEVQDWVYVRRFVNQVSFHPDIYTNDDGEEDLEIGLIHLKGDEPHEAGPLFAWLPSNVYCDGKLVPVLESVEKTIVLMKKLWPGESVMILEESGSK
jgi:hypothetical protein